MPAISPGAFAAMRARTGGAAAPPAVQGFLGQFPPIVWIAGLGFAFWWFFLRKGR